MSLLFSPTNWANPGAIGSTTPSTGAFTTLISNTLQIPGAIGIPFTTGSECRIYNSTTSFAQAPVNNSLGWLIFQSRPNADNRGFCWIGGQTQASIAALHDNGGLQIGSANISSTSPGAGSLRVTAATIAGTTASTSTTTGALIVSGGAGIAGALNVGTFATEHQINGSVVFDRQNTNQIVLQNSAFNTGARSSFLFSALDGTGGTIRSCAAIQNIVEAATLNTNITAGFEFVTTSANSFSSTANGRLRIFGSGGVSIAANSAAQIDPGNSNLRVAGTTTIAGTTASTSTTTGALTVSGGAGIAGALNVGSTITGSQFRLSALNTAPTSAGDTGVLGEVQIDANFIYVCTATNTWKRAAISTW